MAFATQTLTFAANASNGDTVTIGSKTYTLQSTLTNVDGNVKIGASAALTLVNLKNAINLDAGTPGTDYAAAMTEHPTVRATAVTATTLVVKSRVNGAVGNHIPTTETGAQMSWGAATMASGSGSPQSDVSTLLSSGQLNAIAYQALKDAIDPDGTA